VTNVYEPPGNTDWWKVVGDTPLVVMVVVMGHVEYLGPGKVATHHELARPEACSPATLCFADS
jgi:2,4'-dihydroxyacetophenone dioxygenase